MLAYPEWLPLPVGDDYGFEPVSPMVKSKLNSGRTRTRCRSISAPTAIPVSWIFDNPEAQLFEAWFEEVLVSGTSWFECPLKTPLGLGNYQAKFDDIYSGPVLVGEGLWRFTATLWLVKRPILDPGWASEAPDYILMSDIVDIAVNKDWPGF
ncbi:hypothetical protein D9M71_699150 [compost metagenome]